MLTRLEGQLNDDPSRVSAETVYHLALSYRDIQVRRYGALSWIFRLSNG